MLHNINPKFFSPLCDKVDYNLQVVYMLYIILDTQFLVVIN